MSKQYEATLVRGESYTHLKTKSVFRRNTPVVVDAETKEYLEKNAVDVLNQGDETFEKPKFKFKEVKAEADAPAAEAPAKATTGRTATRTATRAAAAPAAGEGAGE